MFIYRNYYMRKNMKVHNLIDIQIFNRMRQNCLGLLNMEKIVQNI